MAIPTGFRDAEPEKITSVIDDIDPIAPAQVARLVLCSGKVFYDLLEKRREHERANVAIARIEQLYPFPFDEIQSLLDRYPNARQVVWTQEEPRNQGIWFFMRSRRHVTGMIGDSRELHYAGRDYSASPAVGYYQVHVEQQDQLVRDALGIDS